MIGKAFRPLIGVAPDDVDGPTIVGPQAYVGHYSVVGVGSQLSASVVLDDFTVVECEVVIGERTLVIYRAQICNNARIGRDCVIGGFIAERVVVGDRSRVFGKIVHSQYNPGLPWDAPEAEEPSAVLAEDVFVGFDAIVAGPITIEAGAYVCAGAIVTRDVPPGHVVSGVNRLAPYSEWRGRLRDSPFFLPRARPQRSQDDPDGWTPSCRP